MAAYITKNGKPVAVEDVFGVAHVGTIISNALKRKNFSVERFADRASLEINEVKAILAGKEIPNDEFLIKAGAFFGGDIYDLFVAINERYLADSRRIPPPILSL